MKDERRLAARLTADHVSALEQELNEERGKADPDWERIECLSKEAAQMFVTEQDAEDGKQALLAALSAQQKPRIQTIRWGHFAVAAAIAGIAAFSVPAVFRQKNAIERIPEPIVSETTAATTTTGTAAQTDITAETTAQQTTQTEVISTAQTTASAQQTDAAIVTTTQSVQTAISETASQTSRRIETTAEPASSAVTQSSRTSASAPQTSASVTSETVSQPSETVSVSEVTYTEPITQTISTPAVTSVPDDTGIWNQTDETFYHVTDLTGWTGYTETTTSSVTFATSVVFYILDEADEQPVSGLHLQIYDMNGALILDCLTDGEPVILDQVASEYYRLHAEEVPEGYLPPRRDQIIAATEEKNYIYLRHQKEEESL
jgi:hypothetical protein